MKKYIDIHIELDGETGNISSTMHQQLGTEIARQHLNGMILSVISQLMKPHDKNCKIISIERKM